MTKLVLILSFIGLALLLTVGIMDPNSPVMWLASTTQDSQILRSGLMLMVFTLLVTEPPRNILLRGVVGIVSVSLVGWAASAGYQNQMPIVDAMLYLAVGIAAGITILERSTTSEPTPVSAQTIKQARTHKRKLAAA